jgi:hypothetical protein
MALASVPPLFDLYGETAAAIIVTIIIAVAAANTVAHVLALICTALLEPNNPLCVAPTPTSAPRARAGDPLTPGRVTNIRQDPGHPAVIALDYLITTPPVLI